MVHAVQTNVAQQAYKLALAQTVWDAGILNPAIAQAGSAQKLWEANEPALTRFLGRAERAKKIIELRKTVQPERLEPLYAQAGIDCIGLDSPLYPELLRQVVDPPFMLYVRGEGLNWPQRHLGVVGTRHCTDYGQRAVHKILGELVAYTPCIVSGLAAGIDTIAHRAALDYHLNTIAVFGTGIDQIYPRGNQKLSQAILDAGGALVSEYPMGYPANAYMFPRRNRIIAGLSLGTLVIEGEVKSGALITAKHSMEENRQVMAVPGNIFSPTSGGPNQLIRDGAFPVTCGEDVVQALNWQPAGTAQQQSLFTQDGVQRQILADLPADQRDVLLAVGYEPTPFEAIQARHATVSIMALNTTLTMLELQGLITPLPGDKFCRV